MQPMTPEEAQFLREIRQAPPGDLEPRLVYADWLEERGDSRGELIRVQCELAALPNHVEELNDEAFELREHLVARDEELQAAIEDEWLKPLRSMVRNFSFNLGLIEYVDVDAGELARVGGRLFELAPVRLMTLRNVSRRRREPTLLPKVAAIDGMRQLTGMVLEDSSLAVEDVAALTTLLESAPVTRLFLSECGINDERLAPLGELKRSELEVLDLSGNSIYNAGARTLAQTPGLMKLQYLDLSSNQIRLRGAQALAASPYLYGLDLVVRNNPISVERRATDILKERFELKY